MWRAIAILRTIFSITLVILSCSNLFASPLTDSVKILFHFHGTTDSSQIGSRVMGLGDINNDGFDDIAFNSVYPRGTYIFYGGKPADSFPDYFLRGYIDRAFPLDFTGDGIPDLVTTLLDNKVLLYKGYVDSLESLPSDSIAPDTGVFQFGSSITAGPVSEDLIADLLMTDMNHPGGGKLYYFENPFTTDKTPDWTFEIVNNSHTMSGITILDFNGDTFQDVIVSLQARLDSLSYVYVYLGPQFQTAPDIVLSAPIGFDSLDQERFAEAIFNVGDANGDNWEDLAVIFHSNVLIYLCGPGADSFYDYYLQGGARAMSAGGDLNGDGFNDILAGDGRTLDGVVDIYLGGPTFDQYYDCTVYRSDLPPLFLNRIGIAVSTAGDFNNDGYNDFIFSCLNFFAGDPGDVFVIAGGSDFVTDVKDPSRILLPEEYELFQNYPNPFNSTTTINFSLPSRSRVTIDILNLNGQLVKRIVSSEFSAGKHSAFWDGSDAGGNTVSSGVYIYMLKSDEFQLSKKLLLIK